jgi:hypothetical protein
MDTTFLAAALTASASIIAVAFTYLTKLVSELVEKRRQSRMHLMAIRNELVVNCGLAEAIDAQARTFGFRFTDKVWTATDTSCIYRKGIPTDQILEIYSRIQLFNTLNARYELIWGKENYRNKDKKLKQEHAEMVALAGGILAVIKALLPKMK